MDGETILIIAWCLLVIYVSWPNQHLSPLLVLPPTKPVTRKHTNKNYPERTWTPKAISNKYYFFGTYLTDYNTKGEIYTSPLCNRPHKTLTHWGLQCKGLVTRWIPTGPGRKQTAFQSKTKFLVKAYEIHIGDYICTHTHTHTYNNKSTGGQLGWRSST